MGFPSRFHNCTVPLRSPETIVPFELTATAVIRSPVFVECFVMDFPSRFHNCTVPLLSPETIVPFELTATAVTLASYFFEVSRISFPSRFQNRRVPSLPPPTIVSPSGLIAIELRVPFSARLTCFSRGLRLSRGQNATYPSKVPLTTWVWLIATEKT